MSKKKTHDEYVAELAIKNPNVEVVEEYKGTNIPILHRCKIHNIVWSAYPTNILRGHGCQMCGNNIKKTQEQYIKEVAIINPNIKVVGTYISAKTKILHHCRIDGYEWYAAPYAILKGNGRPKCGGNARKSTEEYASAVLNINPNIDVFGNYINATTPILHKCKIDGCEWLAEPANILSGCGCPECKARMLHNMFVKSHEQYVKEVTAVNPDIEVLEAYINARVPILHRCKKDGYTWKIAPYNILTGQGCPQCQESNGERRIRRWLEACNIAYTYQKTFINCKDKKELPFDFYLQDYNMCIEYDDRQHFEAVDFAGKGEDWAEEQFIKVKRHDEIKNRYCKNNNVHLLRIPYYKSVEEELDNFYLFNTVI